MKKLLALILSSLMILSMTVTVGAADYLDRTGWKVSASSVLGDNAIPENLIDGSNDTIWHSYYDEMTVPIDAPIYQLTFTFPKVQKISGISYTPKQYDENGRVTAFNIYASASDKGKAQLIFSGKLENNTNMQEKSFGFNIEARTIVFEITESVWKHGSMAEFNVLKSDSKLQTKTLADFASAASIEIGALKTKKDDNSASSGTNNNSSASSDNKTSANLTVAEYIGHDGWKVTASSVFDTGAYPPEHMIDDNPDSIWHSVYDNGVPTDTPPLYLTFTLPKTKTVSGFGYTPRTDNESGIVTGYNIYASDSDKGKAYLIYSGKLAADTDVKNVSFEFNIDVRTVIFEITEGKWNYGTCAEFNLIAQDKKAQTKKISDFTKKKSLTIGATGAQMQDSLTEFLTNKKEWKVSASSEKNTWYHATNVIDGSASSFWSSDYTDDGANILTQEKPPHWLEFTLPEATEISGFQYIKRGDGNQTGVFQTFEFAVSDSDSGEMQTVQTGEFTTTDTMTQHFPKNIKVKRVRITAISAVGDFGTCGEFNLIKKDDKLQTAQSAQELAKAITGSARVMIPVNEISATTNTAWSAENKEKIYKVDAAVDNNKDTVWHSSTKTEGDFPYTLWVDLGSVHTVRSILYVPRNDTYTTNGIWTDFDVYAKETEDGPETKIVANGSFEVKLESQYIQFDSVDSVKARYFRFVVNNGDNGFATLADLLFYETQGDIDERAENNYYVLTVDSDTMVTVKDGVKTEKKLDVAPFIDNSYTLIPLRGLFEEMGAAIEWNGENRKITVDCDGIKIELQIDNDRVYVTDKRLGRVRYNLRVYPQIKDSRTFVPLRFISENLGYNVEWNGEDRTIKISK